MKTETKYVPFPIGTVRGPFLCGFNNQADAGYQYCVKEPSGCWRYFIGAIKDQKKLLAEARAFSYSVTKWMKNCDARMSRTAAFYKRTKKV